jgi:hypothetical protein
MCRMTVTNVVDLDVLRAALPESRGDYAAAVPFPHIVIDDVLTPSAYTAARQRVEVLQHRAGHVEPGPA